MRAKKAIVVVPTHNECGTITELIRQILAQQDNVLGVELHVLIVDGASTDGTVEYVSSLSHEDPRVHLLVVGRRGLGIALLKAYDHAANELGVHLIAQMDADFSHAPRHLPALLGALVEGYDLSIGSRYVPGGGTSGWPLSRRLQSFLANRFASLASGHHEVREWTSGYRAFSADLYRRFDLETLRYDDYTVQPALVLEALRAGGRVKEVPITFVNRQWGKSKLPLFRYTFHLVKHFSAARFRRRAGSSAPWPLSALE